jgi:AraC-like DNA-binding protein
MLELPNRLLAALTPWDPDVQSFIEMARKQVPFDTMALAVFHGRTPQPDELLVRSGIPAEAAVQWCTAGLEASSLFRLAKKQGMALSTDDQAATELGLPAQGEVMLHVLPESLSEPRWWWLLLANHRRPFTIIEQRVAGLLLKQWQAEFNQLQKPVVFRLLVGHDNRLIHADPWTQVQLLENPSMLNQLTDTLHTIIQQRWPAVSEGTIFDFAVELAGRPFWVRFHRTQVTGSPNAAHFYLELHPLEAGELPTIGSIGDDRVARAVGFIHERFQDSPSLAEIASAVHVSPFHFHRLFTSSLGISPKHYLQQKQLQVAKWLLRSAREPICTVATKAGFASHGHFSSTFQRLVCKSPSQYSDEAA